MRTTLQIAVERAACQPSAVQSLFYVLRLCIKVPCAAQHWWLTPVILDTWEGSSEGSCRLAQA
jgi:hypothetical protein